MPERKSKDTGGKNRQRKKAEAKRRQKDKERRESMQRIRQKNPDETMEAQQAATSHRRHRVLHDAPNPGESRYTRLGRTRNHTSRIGGLDMSDPQQARKEHKRDDMLAQVIIVIAASAGIALSFASEWHWATVAWVLAFDAQTARYARFASYVDEQLDEAIAELKKHKGRR